MPAASPARRRKFDLVLHGASGFVGRQTVACMAAHTRLHAPDLRWALAGGNPAGMTLQILP